jgi:quercetin dioxygenase-like cupin family protein
MGLFISSKQNNVLSKLRKTGDFLDNFSYITASKAGVEIDFKELSIGSDKYYSLNKLTKLRCIKSLEDLRTEEKKLYAKYLTDLNFDEYTVLSAICQPGQIVEPHFHKENEILICGEGEFVLSLLDNRGVTTKRVSKGQLIEIPSKVVHWANSIVITKMLSIITKDTYPVQKLD